MEIGELPFARLEFGQAGGVILQLRKSFISKTRKLFEKKFHYCSTDMTKDTPEVLL